MEECILKEEMAIEAGMATKKDDAEAGAVEQLLGSMLDKAPAAQPDTSLSPDVQMWTELLRTSNRQQTELMSAMETLTAKLVSSVTTAVHQQSRSPPPGS